MAKTLTTIPCPICNHTGYNYGEPCPACKTRGELTVQFKYFYLDRDRMTHINLGESQ